MDERLMWQGVARSGAAVTSAVHEAVARAGAWIEALTYPSGDGSLVRDKTPG